MFATVQFMGGLSEVRDKHEYPAPKHLGVLPNLFFLLPTDLGTDFGVQIERFAIDPSDTVKAELIATLESLRQEALAEDAFIAW